MYQYVIDNMPENRKLNYYPDYFYTKKLVLITAELNLKYFSDSFIIIHVDDINNNIHGNKCCKIS